MKRILAVAISLVLILCAYFAVHPRHARAQNTPFGLTMGTTVNANIYGGQTYFYLLISGGNVTTFNITNTNAAGTAFPPNPQTVTVIFQQDATGSRTVGWGTMFATAVIPTVTATANKYCVMQFYYDSASALWYPLSTAAIHN
jgi:hypothetical protein